MGSVTLFFTSLGLSMDACAVSISNGMCYQNIHKKQIITTAAAFGFFQAFMPVLGFFIGSAFSQAIESLDHWIALLLFAIPGILFAFSKILFQSHPA
jgi:putative Mn2+ efflux pump MntP